MAKQRSSFAKLQRDKAKKERAAMKRANRQQRKAEAEAEAENPTPADGDGELVPGEGELSAPELLALIEDLHKRREAGTISLEDFEEAKVELFARLPGRLRRGCGAAPSEPTPSASRSCGFGSWPLREFVANSLGVALVWAKVTTVASEPAARRAAFGSWRSSTRTAPEASRR